jgi:hypothetical protein
LKPSIKINAHPDYLWYRMDRLDREKGGVAIVINRKLQHKPLPAVKVNLLEAIGVKVFTEGSSINFYSVYLPRIEMFRIHMPLIFAKFAVIVTVISYVVISILGIGYGTVNLRTGPAEFSIMS